jgi:hypothetical protein
MKLRPILTAALLVAAALAGGRAGAQGLSPQLPRPAVSPYINLLRRGTNPAINYYGLVRPIVDQQAYNQQFVDREARLQSELDQQQQTSPLEETARVARFQTAGQVLRPMSHRAYFQTLGAGGTAAAPAQATATASAPGRPAVRATTPR